MLEMAILTCLEASKVISNIQNHPSLNEQVKVELIQTILDYSECTNGTI